MSEQAALIVMEGFLDGVFDVFNAMLPHALGHESKTPNPMQENELRQALTRCPVVLRAGIQGGLGAIAVLLPLEEASRLSAMISETEYASGQGLDADAQATLRETAESALGSGVTNLMQRFGRAVEQLEEVALLDNGVEAFDEITALMRGEAIMSEFTFSDERDFTGNGVALCSQSLVALVPESLLQQVPPESEKPVLSQTEVKDILGGLDTNVEAQDSARPAAYAANLERVLDIRLVAQARLGRVEMPINQLLTLGPGSVVDVGHLVDEPIELLVNNKLIARGDVVVVDEKFGLRITHIVSPQERIESLR